MLKSNTSIKLSDYVASKVAELGIDQVFMVTGGGAMHLNQSLGHHKALSCLFNHHEQACAMAAESYARLTNKPALVNVTTGPGATNTITGIHGAWTDSMPLVVISGQVKRQTIAAYRHSPVRQLGDQEVDICSIVQSITKYSVQVTDPTKIRFHLEKAYYLATTGRPGPVWLDIPIDVQSCIIEPNQLTGFKAPTSDERPQTHDYDVIASSIIDEINLAETPVILAGTGVRTSGSVSEFRTFVDKTRIPVTTAWNAHDLLPTSHDLFVGKPGTVGDRAGNFAVQNADLLIVLGCRLNIRQISYNWESFAKHAKIIMVDIDANELYKPTLNIDLPIEADLSQLIPSLTSQAEKINLNFNKWLSWCIERRESYPVVEPKYWSSPKINPYCFMKVLFDQMSDGQITVAANGSACVVGFQAAKIKENTRLWTNSGCASMGYDLPAAIGAAVGAAGKSIVCLAGDGSIMMNLQELETIAGNKLPIKIFILNNQGYSSIYQTHHNFFNGQEIGASPNSGVTLPNFEKISKGFNIAYARIAAYGEMSEVIDLVLNAEGPQICEVILDEKQGFAPKLASKQLDDGSMVSPELDDMAPFLSDSDKKK